MKKRNFIERKEGVINKMKILQKCYNGLSLLGQKCTDLLRPIYPEFIDEELMKFDICSNKTNRNYNVKNMRNMEEKYFDNHIYLFKYEGVVRQKIIDYKFNDKAYLNETFVKIMLKNEKMCRFLESYDIIIPVPIHKKRKKVRGYNQSEIIAKKLAKNLKKLEFVNDCLIKKENTIEQSSLNKWQRIENAKGVYILKNEQKIINKNIIIFDDIYTTGSTVNECARVLKRANANKILVLTLAKD